jgi:hypothetical protein
MRTIEETLEYLADELNRTNLRVLDLEGQNLALQGLLASAIHKLCSQDELEAVKKIADGNVSSLQKYRATSDEASARMIDAFIAQTNGILSLWGDPDTRPLLSIITGGKSDN